MMRAVIIDDNENARIALKSDLTDYCETISIVGEASGVAEGITLINKENPEVVFLDIRMGDGTGFDLLERFKPISDLPFKVIFTTAYDEFALKAFKYAAVDYLLKPIDSDSLVSAVDRLKELTLSNSQKQLNDLLSHIAQPKQTKISLSEMDRIHIVSIDTIIRCESEKNYTTFFLENGKKITVSKTIKEFDLSLAANDFLRVHHSHLVNLNQIKEVVKIDGPYLLMNDGATVPVSSRKKEQLYQRMKQMW